MEELLDDIGISGKLEQTANGKILNIANSDEFAKVYSKLDRSELVNEADESSQITPDTISVQYYNDDYTLTLLGDLAGDAYTLTIRDN